MAWQALTPNMRRLLMSHLPDDMERDLMIRHSVVTALESVYGPRLWDASVAVVAEGDEQKPPKEQALMSWTDIGAAIGVSDSRAQQIFNRAMRKLRHRSRLRLLRSLLDSTPWEPLTVDDSEVAA